MLVNEEPIIVEQDFTTSIGKVWNAITSFEEMTQWFFENIPSFNSEVGFETQFAVHVEDRTFTHLWKITEVIPEQKIVYNWKYAEYPGDSFVTFELFEDKSHVKLKLSVRIVEDFPDDIPEFKRESGLEGWTYFIRKRLKEYFENKIK
jgi:uncharacterized protein YndB with AHSA1/START domain